jgi:hypothetical protein
MEGRNGNRNMKRIFFGILLCAGVQAMSEQIDVFYLGGQSNATHAWRKGVEHELKQAYGDTPFVIVHAFHPGQWLKKWITQEPQALFLEDFANPEGSGMLETEWKKLKAEGKEPVFRGWFWMQGEGDTGNVDDQKTYADRFNRLRALAARAVGQEPPPFVVGVIDGNQDPRYDDPQEAAGRTREQMEGMRQVLFQLGRQEDGAAVDSREYKRTDLWHLTPAEQQRLGAEMARAWLKTFRTE